MGSFPFDGGFVPATSASAEFLYFRSAGLCLEGSELSEVKRVGKTDADFSKYNSSSFGERLEMYLVAFTFYIVP